MSDQIPAADRVQPTSPEQVATNVARGIGEPYATLVADWMTVEDAAEQLALPVSRVKVLAREHTLVVTGRRSGWLPALFIDGSEIVKGLPGTLTLLSDAGYDPLESIQWLYTADDMLPGRPIDALCEDRGREVRRRAQALGF